MLTLVTVITDSGHWAVCDIANRSALLVDGVVRGSSASEVVISSDGRNVAWVTDADVVMVNGVAVATVRDAWLEVEGSTLYIYR